MNIMLSGRKDKLDVNRSFNIENEINNYRNQLKSQNINDVNSHEYTYAIGHDVYGHNMRVREAWRLRYQRC